MEICFYVAAFVAFCSTFWVVTGTNPVHALLNLVVSLLAVAMIFFTLGAPFAGMLEVIVYVGAIMVLFVFVVMMLNLGEATVQQEKRWLAPKIWTGPAVLSLVLLTELMHVLAPWSSTGTGLRVVGAREVGAALYGPYLLAVELASMLLLAALVAAYHLGKHE
ncbi:MAG: NADH-quinone oxidoreductase subunit J [Stenotrophobium sp.]